MANTIKVQSTEGKVDNKKCYTCKKTKPINKFYLTRYNTYEKNCKKCRNEKREEGHRHWKQQFIYKLSQYLEIKCVECGYDKNFSNMIEQEVSTNYIDFAERYWKEAGPIIDNPIEPQQSKVVPYNTENSWDCKYCNFNKSCDNPINPLTKGKVNEKEIAI